MFLLPGAEAMKTRVNLPVSDSLRRVSIKPKAVKNAMVLSRSFTCWCGAIVMVELTK